jgi:hypothetical protein
VASLSYFRSPVVDAGYVCTQNGSRVKDFSVKQRSNPNQGWTLGRLTSLLQSAAAGHKIPKSPTLEKHGDPRADPKLGSGNGSCRGVFLIVRTSICVFQITAYSASFEAIWTEEVGSAHSPTDSRQQTQEMQVSHSLTFYIQRA